MKIAIGNDHAGVGVKEKIQEHLEKKRPPGYQQRV